MALGTSKKPRTHISAKCLAGRLLRSSMRRWSFRVSHAGFATPIGVMRQWLALADPVISMPESLNSSFTRSDIAAMRSAPILLYGWFWGRVAMASRGFSTGLPSMQPSSSIEPPLNSIVDCPLATMVTRLPRLASEMPQASALRPPPMMTVSILIARPPFLVS